MNENTDLLQVGENRSTVGMNEMKMSAGPFKPCHHANTPHATESMKEKFFRSIANVLKAAGDR